MAPLSAPPREPSNAAGFSPHKRFYEQVIKVKADVAALLNLFSDVSHRHPMVTCGAVVPAPQCRACIWIDLYIRVPPTSIHSYVPCCLRWQLPRLPQFDVRVHSPHYVSLPESQGKTVLYCTRHHLRIRLPLSLLCRIDLHQDESSATLSTSFPRMWPVSIIRCARAASSSGSISIGGTRTNPASIKLVISRIESRARSKSIIKVIFRKPRRSASLRSRSTSPSAVTAFCTETAGHSPEFAPAVELPLLHLEFPRAPQSRRMHWCLACSFAQRRDLRIDCFLFPRLIEPVQSPARILRFLLARRVSSFATCFVNTPWQRNRIPPFINSRMTFSPS